MKLAALLCLFTLPAWVGCPVTDDIGEPTLTVAAQTTLVCHTGYAAAVDDDALVPRWVAYRLTGPHTLGCGERQNNFHADEGLSPDHRAAPADYSKSGYDRGHMADAADFSWSEGEESDSFSMANMTPQLPGLNRAEWEKLEETVRAWAWGRGALAVFVGPILGGSDTIGHGVVVPMAFYKVIYDPAKAEALAFIMPQQDIKKGPLEPWEVSVGEVERRAGIKLPLSIDGDAKSALWPVDLKGWRKAHSSACQ